MTIGNPPNGRTVRDTGTGMHFVSDYTIPRAGDVVSWEFETFQAAQLELEIWRPTGTAYQYQKVGSSGLLQVAVGENVVPQAVPFAVQPGDVLGWYSPQVQPIPYTDNAGGLKVRRKYEGVVDTISMAGHAAGWTRQYSIAVTIQPQGAPWGRRVLSAAATRQDRPYTGGGGGVPPLDPPLLPFQCLRVTAKMLLWYLRCQED